MCSADVDRIHNALYKDPRPLYTLKKQIFIYSLVRVKIEENMNNNQNFVDAFIHSIQIWNLEMDIEDSNMENIDQRACNRFIYTDLINNGGE